MDTGQKPEVGRNTGTGTEFSQLERAQRRPILYEWPVDLLQRRQGAVGALKAPEGIQNPHGC